MIIKSVRVQNFRSIKDATLHCDKLTMLVGANGSGKSSFLKALAVFGDDNPAITDKDYYNSDTSKSITITVTFADLGGAKTEFVLYEN